MLFHQKENSSLKIETSRRKIPSDRLVSNTSRFVLFGPGFETVHLFDVTDFHTHNGTYPDSKYVVDGIFISERLPRIIIRKGEKYGFRYTSDRILHFLTKGNGRRFINLAPYDLMSDPRLSYVISEEYPIMRRNS